MTTELAETNKQTLQDLLERGLAGDLDAIDELYADDVVYRDPSIELRGIEDVRNHLSAWMTAFPDMTFEYHDFIAEGDSVVSHYTVSGTHENDFQDIPATGKRFEGMGMTIDRFEDGEVVEEVNVWDNLSFIKQLEIDPSEL